MTVRRPKHKHHVLIALGVLTLLVLQLGCARLRLPAIDPNGGQVFLPAPNSTGLLTPRSGAGAFNPLRQNQVNPLFQPPSFSAPAPAPRYPAQPAFQHPATPPPCDALAVSHNSKKHLIPDPMGRKTPGQNGEIIMSPSRIVAPVGSEVVVLAGVCGGDGYFVKNQPLEWMLSNNSVGEFVEVGGMHHPTFNKLIPPTAKKFSGQYAWGRTGMKNIVLSRGTPIPSDDIELRKGQTFVSVSSSSPGTSYVTAVAPKAEGWDKRRKSTTIHWVDGNWSIPVPARATAGTVYPLTTVVNRSDGGGLKGWDVRYTIVGGAPAEFAPAGSQKADATTDTDGKATVQLRQPAGQFDPGTTQIRVDVVRPPLFGEPELIVESGITSVTWSAPALTLRAIGPKTADADTPFNYRVSVSNPGDQVARDVIVRTKNLDDAIEFISSTPKPTEYGRNYEWQLGDIPPGGQPKIIDVQLKSKKRGNVGMCFEVASAVDRLQTEACTQTEIVLPAVEIGVSGPSSARIGDDVTFDIEIQNQASDQLNNVVMRIAYDAGLVRAGSANPIVYQPISIPFGQSEPLQITFNAQAAGTQCFVIEITGDNIQPQTQRQCVVVEGGFGQGNSGNNANPGSSPLTVDLSSPEPTDVGKGSDVTARVTNRGAVALDNVTLITRYSPSIQPAGITNTFNYEFVGEQDEELWVNMGRIEAGQTIPVVIKFAGLEVDPSAKAEFSVSTPSGASSTDSVSFRVAPAGSGFGTVLPGEENVPNFNGGNGQGNGINNGGIGIPDDGANLPRNQAAGGELAVRVQTIDQNIRVGQNARVQISVTNNRATPIRDVEVLLLVPNTLNFANFETDTNLGLENNQPPFYKIQKALEVRSGETLTWFATFEGLQPGQASVEAQAKSIDVVGASSSGDTIFITQ